MTKEQIKDLYPEVYNAIYQEGADSVGEEQGRRNEARNEEQYMLWLRDQSAPEQDTFICNICGCSFDHFTTADVCEHVERCVPDITDEPLLIGNVEVSDIDAMADLLEATDYNTLKDAIFNGHWQEHAMSYVHPMDSLRDTRCFKEIQAAFINGYT